MAIQDNTLLMKNFSFILIIALLSSCEPKDKILEIENIVNSDSYIIEYEYLGCFGGDIETIEISKKDNEFQAVYNSLDFSESDGRPYRRREKIIWNESKDKIVRDIFLMGTRHRDTTSSCTTTATFKLRKFPNTIVFSDGSCRFYEEFIKLINDRFSESNNDK